MNTFNEVLDHLMLEAVGVRADVIAVKTLIEACPTCSVERADVIERLADVADDLAVAAAKLNLLKEAETNEKA